MKKLQLYVCLLFIAIGYTTFAQNPFTEIRQSDDYQEAISDFDVPTRDQVILDDLIVAGSICAGFDCVNGESFGFDTFRMKENNLRMHFQDTSNSSSFPTNDWRFIFNDSSNGGANYFAVEDSNAARQIFRVDAGAPANSLRVDSQGDVGIGTSNPVVDLHTVSGNTPTLRLEQNGTSGFTPQTWDVAGNEAGFFIRDATNGSTLPFRIRPGAPSSSIDISAAGSVGISDTSPNANVSLALGDDDKGLQLNRLTTAARTTLGTSLGAGEVGVMVFDTDENGVYTWDGASWTFNGGASSVTTINDFTLNDYTNNLRISLTNDGQPAHVVSLDEYQQNVDVFTLVGTDLNLSLSDDDEATYTVDLSSLAAPAPFTEENYLRQEAQIIDLLARVEALEACACNNSLGGDKGNDFSVQPDKAMLYQNIPNPFDNTTSIGYFIPFTYAKANMVVSTTTGQILQNINIDKFGVGSIEINKDRMATAMYYYTLYVDGKKVDTKRMIVE